MNTILADVKDSIGVIGDNLGFDGPLLIQINSAAAELAQVGVSEFDALEVKATTGWPAIESTVLLSLVKQYIYLSARRIFDASASSTISNTLDKAAEAVNGRIAHEVSYIEYLAGLV